MRKRIQVAAAIVATAILVGCSSGSSNYSSMQEAPLGMMQNSVQSDGEYYSAGTKGYGDSLVNEHQPAAQDQKITYSASVSMESTDFDGAISKINDATTKYKAYYENTDMSGSADDSSRYANFKVRIPVESYPAYLGELKSTGNVLSVNESAENITSSYIDVESRLSALTSQRARLNELADAAETTSDLLEIESQLSDVQYQIENYTSQMRNMDNKVSYSTINVTVKEVAILTPVNVNYGGQVITAFFLGLTSFVDFIKGLVLGLVYLTPVIGIAAIVTGIVLFASKSKKKQKIATASKSHPDEPQAESKKTQESKTEIDEVKADEKLSNKNSEEQQKK